MPTYQLFMTKVYEVKVEAENEEHATDLFERYGDWEEVLKVHTLDINPFPYGYTHSLREKEIILKEGEDY